MTIDNSLTPFQKISCNIGLIVLASQDLEQNLKFILTLAEFNKGKSIAKSKEKYKVRSLGEIVKNLMNHIETTDTDIEELQLYLKSTIDSRNKYVHHFYETFSEQLNLHKYSEIIGELGVFYKELQHLAELVRSTNSDIAKVILNEHAISN